MADRIDFDHSATTPLDPRVAMAMGMGGGDIRYSFQLGLRGPAMPGRGRQKARGQVAAPLHATGRDHIDIERHRVRQPGFAGVFRDSDQSSLGHMITSAIEHPAIIETCRFLERTGVEVTCLGVDANGLVDPDDLTKAMRPETRLVSLMAANNVVGTLQPIAELARITKEHGALFHTDAVQSTGKVLLDVTRIPVDMVSMSAHKLHGPKGVGGLFVRENLRKGGRNGARLQPVLFGGGQEYGLRSATENVSGIVGFGAAAELAASEMTDEAARLVQLREHLSDGLREQLPQTYLIGHPFKRLPGHLCLGFAGQEGEAIRLLLSLDEAGVAISSGSACSAHKISEPSYVLLAMGFDPIRARGSLRITLGRFNTKAEVDRLLKILPQVVNSLRPVASYAGFSR